MGSMTDTMEKAVLDYIFRSASIGLDATNLWVALFTTSPTDSTTGTEVSAGGYARAAILRTGGGWDAASGTTATTQNTVAVSFSQATADWGSVAGWGICKSLAGALSTDLLYYADLATATPVNNGYTPSLAAGQLIVTQT